MRGAPHGERAQVCIKTGRAGRAVGGRLYDRPRAARRGREAAGVDRATDELDAAKARDKVGAILPRIDSQLGDRRQKTDRVRRGAPRLLDARTVRLGGLPDP